MQDMLKTGLTAQLLHARETPGNDTLSRFRLHLHKYGATNTPPNLAAVPLTHLGLH